MNQPQIPIRRDIQTTDVALFPKTRTAFIMAKDRAMWSKNGNVNPSSPIFLDQCWALREALVDYFTPQHRSRL